MDDIVQSNENHNVKKYNLYMSIFYVRLLINNNYYIVVLSAI